MFSDGSLIELLYRASDAQTAFAVWRDGESTVESEVVIGGERLVPFSPRNNIIKNDVVLLPCSYDIAQVDLLAEALAAIGYAPPFLVKSISTRR